MGVERAIVYIDGFNLYHGLMQARLGSSRWLDLGAMSQSLLGDARRDQAGQVEAWAIRASTAPSMVWAAASTVTVRS